MTPYENFVLENKFESVLSTLVDMSAYLTTDRSLAENAGMKKKINTYTAAGQVEDLTKGNGNTQTIEASYIGKDYTVGVTQGRFAYYDEDAWTDPTLIDAGLRGMAEIMANDFTNKAIAEMSNATQTISCDFSSDDFFNKVVDALALFGENQEGLTLLINPAQQAYVRKQLKTTLQYSEGYARTGYIGSVAGVPVVVSKAVPATCAFIVNREAVTLFEKIGVESEIERSANDRKNTVYMRKVALVALTDASKLVMLGNAQSTACAITTYTKAQKTIAGTCGTDCNLVVVVDGDGIQYTATPSAGSWSVTANENLTPGDKINATAYAPGYAAKAATEVTVAE